MLRFLAWNEYVSITFHKSFYALHSSLSLAFADETAFSVYSMILLSIMVVIDYGLRPPWPTNGFWANVLGWPQSSVSYLLINGLQIVHKFYLNQLKFILKRCHLRSVTEWRENNIAISGNTFTKKFNFVLSGLGTKTDTLLHREDFKLINDQAFFVNTSNMKSLLSFSWSQDNLLKKP